MTRVVAFGAEVEAQKTYRPHGVSPHEAPVPATADIPARAIITRAIIDGIEKNEPYQTSQQMIGSAMTPAKSKDVESRAPKSQMTPQEAARTAGSNSAGRTVLAQAAPLSAPLLAAPLLAAVALLGFVIASPAPAQAHPHVWVDVKTTVVYGEGIVKGFEHHWTFDDMYTAMAIQGLDKNGDGTYDRDELAELTQVNIDGLKEFDYFTYPKLGETALKVGTPRDYWLEHKDGILTLHFLLPLEAPVMADAQGFNFQVYDPSYFIAFDLSEKDPIKLSAGAPSGCKPDVGIPAADTAQAQQLGESFFQQLGGDFGLSLAQTVSIQCPKS